jgi:hypothetical protein
MSSLLYLVFPDLTMNIVMVASSLQGYFTAFDLEKRRIGWTTSPVCDVYELRVQKHDLKGKK